MKTYPNPIRVGVIGCGMFARQTLLPHIASMDEARIHSCCDSNAAAIEACLKFEPERVTSDFLSVVEDPEVDMLVVATSETFRLPIIQAAARAGKPVYCEKPLADTLENANAIEQFVKTSGIPFCVGHNRRCAPALVMARELFVSHMKAPRTVSWRFKREGAEAIPVGDNPGVPILTIRINDDWQSWNAVHLLHGKNREVGLILSEGTHFADLATWFLDSEPVEVHCIGSGILNHVITIRYANAGIANITMAGTGSLGYPKELLEVFGNAGALVVDHMLEVRSSGIEDFPAIHRFPLAGSAASGEAGFASWFEQKVAACREAADTKDVFKQFSAEADKGHRNILREFIREIRGLRAPVCPISDAITATKICLAAVRSRLESRPVRLAELT